MPLEPRRSSLKCSLLLSCAAVLLAFPAGAVDLDLKFEPGLAVPLGAPQSQRFGFGGAATMKVLAGFEGSYVNAAGGITFLGLAAKSGYASTDLGTAWAPSFGLRVQAPRESEALRLANPHAEQRFYGARPWIDADIAYVGTGGLSRIGFLAAAGVSFPIGQSRSWWLGPFVRYFQIHQANTAGFDATDAKTLIVGLSLEAGTRVVREQPPAVVDVAAPAPAPVAAAAVACIPRPDRDADGVPDDVDACPDVAGPASNSGCPVYSKVIIKPDKLELKEKIQFEWNTGVIDVVSHPLLNEVAQALKDNKGFRVAIEGHASSEGGEEHNQTLSEARGAAVLEYLAKQGIARDRLVSSGFSSSRPLQSNATEAGREANRRVDFVVYFVILKEAGK